MRDMCSSLRISLHLALFGVVCGAATAVHALPTGYFVWSKGTANTPSSRKIYRITLPGKTDEQALTSGEDVSCQISPDGKWVAYAKAKLPGGTDYHALYLWKLYIVSIHGAVDGRQEIKIDDSGAWPSWGGNNVLYYNQVDDTHNHSMVLRVTLDEDGQVKDRQTVLSTRDLFPAFTEVNECFMSPDGSWFAARTRGALDGVGAYWIAPPQEYRLAQAGDIGCMPYVAPSGTWGLIAGSTQGIRWGDAPNVPGRKEDQLLIAAKSGHRAYHPGISSDEKWVMAAQGTAQDHNGGAYDISIYPLDANKQIGPEQTLVAGGFNGWPALWVGTPTAPPKPKPRIVDFYPASYTLLAGEKTMLSWNTLQATRIELDGSAVAASGTQDVQPAATTTYALLAATAEGNDTATTSCTVKVNSTATAVEIVSFAATKTAIEQGQSTSLSWQVENPTTLSLDGQRIAPTGSLSVEPRETRSYVLTAQGHLGPQSRSVTITVEKLKPVEPELYADRGGFHCSLDADRRSGVSGGGALLLLGLLLSLRGQARRSGARRSGSRRRR